jgi:hypothetical protein
LEPLPLVGVSRRLKGADPGVRGIGVRPAEADLTIEGLVHATADDSRIWDPDGFKDSIR